MSQVSPELPGYPNPKLPGQLVDLTGPQPRFIMTRTEKLDGPRACATLSHCWRANPALSTLTATNPEEMRRSIAVSALPKPFQDAIVVVERPSIRYL
ncbi:uncharacterized protein K452DRAFT_220655 [Aplosporella prunicola CBS 121167]|uniref:Uncharacterized protein n=1 Tax=Aplosporella prunicola CBS 121167 TaxID=1176127 RepID=A0A6A6BN62_9PEZI|nr:uncharacterized protein K452DRAFT_220655 [Aplosporella prunicola CBS 121167]KAF2145570.1 hypothetical protein K452DRAFT_220655 [Aplosporella prunicola CBS 121167]